MNKYRRQTNTVIFSVIVILVITTAFSYAYVMGNFGELAYEFPVDPEDPALKSKPLNAQIINGAGSYLAAYSNFMLLLNRVEMADVNGVDYMELGNILDNAVVSMEKAREAYTLLKQMGDTTPYNPVMIGYLLTFDYNGFRESHGLNATIFEKLSLYMGKGDVNGVFGYLLTSTTGIAQKLYNLKESVDAEKLPDLEDLWRINQDFSETMLFGQYAAKIFKNFIINRGKK